MKNFTNIESDGTGIERDGTGIESDGTGIERDGTGIESDGTGIERDGTGIRRLSLVASLCVALGMVSSVAFADPANLQISRQNDTITVSWFNNGELYVGRGSALGTQSAIALSKVQFNSPYFNLEVDGDGTGLLVDGDGTGLMVDGDGTGKQVDGDGTGLLVDGDGTGKQVDGDGTGIEVDGDGTGLMVDGDGTGLQVDGDGTGLMVDGDGTGLQVDGDGTGLLVDGDGTGVNGNGQFSFMVEINMGCQSTQATIYETGNFSAVEYIELNQPSISAGACNQGLQPVSTGLNLGN